jgi:hypothetical protein
MSHFVAAICSTSGPRTFRESTQDRRGRRHLTSGWSRSPWAGASPPRSWSAPSRRWSPAGRTSGWPPLLPRIAGHLPRHGPRPGQPRRRGRDGRATRQLCSSGPLPLAPQGPRRDHRMVRKWVVTGLVTVAVAAALAGCGASAPKAKGPATTTSTSSTPTSASSSSTTATTAPRPSTSVPTATTTSTAQAPHISQPLAVRAGSGSPNQDTSCTPYEPNAIHCQTTAEFGWADGPVPQGTITITIRDATMDLLPQPCPNTSAMSHSYTGTESGDASADCAWPYLQSGSYYVWANYSGDSTYPAETSPTITVTILPGPTS